MWLLAGLSLLAAVLVFARVPRGLHVGLVDAAAWRALARHPVILRVVSVTAIHASAQFVLFSYLTVAYREAIAASPGAIALLLAVMGGAGFTGNVLAGRIGDRVGPPVLIFAAITLMLSAFVLWTGLFVAGPGTFGMALALLAALLWGSGNFSANSMQQVRLVNLAPALSAVSVALNTSAIYLGQFIGAALGGLLLAHPLSEPASRALPWVGLPIFGLALWVSWSAQRRVQRQA